MTILLSAWVVDEPDALTKKLAHRTALKFVTNALHTAVQSRELKERTAKAVVDEGPPTQLNLSTATSAASPPPSPPPSPSHSEISLRAHLRLEHKRARLGRH